MEGRRDFRGFRQINPTALADPDTLLDEIDENRVVLGAMLLGGREAFVEDPDVPRTVSIIKLRIDLILAVRIVGQNRVLVHVSGGIRIYLV